MKVQVLLSTYNGEQYLEEQLKSIFRQKGVICSILVRDDGSVDKTIDILEYYSRKGLLRWYNGSNLQPAKSYFDLMVHADDADFYAFCDQDDVWEEDKLLVAVDSIKHSNREALYFSSTTPVNKDLVPINSKLKDIKAMSFETALIENNVTGCTVVFNRKLLELFRHYIPNKVLMHDSWLYLLCIYVNGDIICDRKSHILYRQHDSNVIGSSNDMRKRISSSGFNRKNVRYQIANELYRGFREKGTERNQNILRNIMMYRYSLKSKLWLIFDRHFIATSVFRSILVRIYLILDLF